MIAQDLMYVPRIVLLFVLHVYEIDLIVVVLFLPRILCILFQVTCLVHLIYQEIVSYRISRAFIVINVQFECLFQRLPTATGNISTSYSGKVHRSSDFTARPELF